MVAARRLRKSMLKEMPDIDIEGINNISNSKHKHRELIDESIFIKENIGTLEEDGQKNKKNRIKIILKIFISILIIFTCLIVKLFLKEQAMSNKYIAIFVTEYNKDYTKIGCIEKFEDIVNSIYVKTKYIIPEQFANNIKEKYIFSVKPYLVNFEVKNAIEKIFVKSEEIEKNELEKNELNIEENTGMGGGYPISQTMNVPELDAQVIAMYDRINDILEKNIYIKQPVTGTITSRYGTREKIFEELSTYHTGIDIANKIGTEIHSATIGIVKKAEENNKYYGNNIEIETDGVIFKYAHLKDFNVKEGDIVTQETVIGYMGSTGMSTGSHLHFEIKINGETVDPDQILEFK